MNNYHTYIWILNIWFYIYVFDWDIFLFELWFDIYDFRQSDYVLTFIPSQWGLFNGTLIPSHWGVIH